jgi:hypothetical protein
MLLSAINLIQTIKYHLQSLKFFLQHCILGNTMIGTGLLDILFQLFLLEEEGTVTEEQASDR